MKLSFKPVIPALIAVALSANLYAGSAQKPPTTEPKRIVNTVSYPSDGDYHITLDRIDSRHKEFSERFLRENKGQVVQEARRYLTDVISNELIPSWFGTRWDFYGTSERPNEGGIACGVFVTTILRDAGFNIDRLKYAQQPSENIIKSLMSEASISRYSNKDIDYLTNSIERLGQGIFIAGLDCHTGFVISDNNGINFAHSSYYNPPLRVVSEPIGSDNPFCHSKYKVLGKILDDEMMLNWLANKKMPLKYDYFKKK